jgi:ABC-type transport system substrate-binding protein
MSPDGKTWTFNLREGVPFHGDKWGEFTSKDVAHSITQITQESALATDASTFRALLGETEEEVLGNIETPDDHTVILHTKSPTLDMELNVSAQQGNLLIHSKAQWDAEGMEGYEKGPAGTGSWQLVEHKLSRHLLFKATENHWRKTPGFEELQQFAIPESVSRLAMILTGEAHISEVDRDLHSEVRSRGKEVVSSGIEALSYFWAFGGVYREDLEDRYDPTVPALDVRVREAMNRAINREEINDNLFAGATRPHVVSGYHSSLLGWNPRWLAEFDDKYGYDPDKAKQLIKDAGYPDGFKIQLMSLTMAGLPEMIQLAEVVSIYLQDVGIEAEIVDFDSWGSWRPYYREKKTHNWLWQIPSSYRPSQKSVQYFNISGAGGFVSACESKLIDDKFEVLKASIDPEERNRLLQEIGDYKFDTYCDMPMFWLPAQVVIDPEVVQEYAFPGNISTFYTHLEYAVPVMK